MQLEGSHKNKAFERFLSDGSIALLPFGENQVKCVWVVPEDKIEAVKSLSDFEFLKKIQEQFGFRVGRFMQMGRRVYYPLRTVYADNVYADRVVLIGNAANSLHPIAAQGFNLGLRDVATLAALLQKARIEQQDIGGIDVLRQFAEGRYEDHEATRKFSEQLIEPSILHWFGILATVWMLPFKRKIALQGLGKKNELFAVIK